MYYQAVRKLKGFTLVELLVVIVAIAIIAAISVVAYTNIKDRAERTAIVVSVRQYATMIENYIVLHNKAPRADWRCLGDATTLPAVNGYEEGFCFKPANAGTNKGDSAPADPNLMAELRPLADSLPNIDFPEVRSTIAGGRSYRGIIYDGLTNNFTGSPAVLMYFTRFPECPIGDRVSYWASSAAGMSGCAFQLSANEKGGRRP